MPITDKLKKAKDQAAKTLAENEKKISGAVDKAGTFADTRTKGRYRDKIDKATGAVKKGVGKAAEQGAQAGGAAEQGGEGGGASQPGSGPKGGSTTEHDSTPDEEQGSGPTP